MKRFIARCIWDFSEWTGIPLGRFAHIVFGIMVGCKGRRIDIMEA